jgi:hypothetical protein
MKTKTLLSLLTLACLLAVPATAQVNYAVSGGTAYVTSSPNASGNIVIASTYQGKPVTSIAYSAFSYCTSLRNVMIPNNVVSPQQPGGFRFLVRRDAGLSVRVQRSANLRDWEDWQALTLGATPSELSDLDASTNSHRFYRAVTP